MTAKLPKKPRRVAVMLELEWPLKRHVALFAGLQQYAQQHGWVTTIDEVIGDKLPQRRTKSLPYDGIIGRVPKPLAEQAIRLNLPVVNVWFSSPAREMLPGVFPDVTAAGGLRAEHLLARGLRNFAVLTSRRDQGDEAELEEFRRLIGEVGFRCAGLKVALHALQPQNWRATEEAITGWMDQWQLPLGLYASQEIVGRLVSQLCRDRGWRVPQDVAIIAGRNEEVICEHPQPALSSVEMGYERVGQEAARLLERLMDEREQGKPPRKATSPEHVFVPPRGVVVRESTDFFAVDDTLIADALAFIAANSQRQINANDVAQALNIGLRSLQSRFNEVVGRPISAEIQRGRIERAKRELVDSKRPIKEIAHDVGFGRARRMNEAFRRELGVTPGEYRRQRRVGNGT